MNQYKLFGFDHNGEYSSVPKGKMIPARLIACVVIGLFAATCLGMLILGVISWFQR